VSTCHKRLSGKNFGERELGNHFAHLWRLEDDFKTVYLWSKVVCLFCFVLMRSWDASDCVLGVFGKVLMRRGAWTWFREVWTCSAKVLECWIISSLKIKLNCSWKFRRNWNVPLRLLERSLWAGLNEIYLIRFGFRMWEIVILKWFLSLKIQINFEKWGFGRKIQLGMC
jgi:hypothetical protein